MKLLSRAIVVCLLASPALAQTPYAVRHATLASSFDLDGEAADADQVVTSATLADSTSYTIAADPDICRLVDVTVTDADSSTTAGILTIDGFDCWGYPLRVTYTMSGGSGVRTGTVVDAGTASTKKASGAFFSDVTTAVTGVLTGEGVGDTITVGYTGNSPKGWVLYGKQQARPDGSRLVDVFGVYDVNVLVKNGAATTDVIAVSASTTAPFENVSVGDLLIFNASGQRFVRRVATKADADTITIGPTGVTLVSAGINFAYRKRFFSTDPQDGWISVEGWDAVTFVTQVDANANTGGVITSVECADFSSSDAPNPEIVFEEDTATVASGATGTDTTNVDLRLKPHYTHCRSALKFGTGDDADSAAEDISVVIGFRK